MKKILSLLSISLILSSCSVVMASNREGTDIDGIQNIRNKTQMIALGGDPVTEEINEEGERVEIYRILKEKGSIARACMHGLLDIGTAFLWEFAGTPIESSLSEKKYYSVKVTLDTEDQIRKIELF